MYIIMGALFLGLGITMLYLCSALYMVHICEIRNVPTNILIGFFIFAPIINTILSVYFGLRDNNYKESLIRLFRSNAD